MGAVSAVVGVGHTRYGRLPEFDAYELGLWALKDALADAGLRFADIDGLIVNRIPDYQRFCEIAGISPDYVNITPGQGRFSGIDIETAAALIRDGLATTVALVYGNNGRSAGDRYGGAGDTYGSGGAGNWFPYGMTSPGAFHALMARRHMELYGTTPDHLGTVSKTFRDHAALNPSAVMRNPFTLADYHASRYICEPLHLLDYCLINDGGVALILTTAERARDLKQTPVYVRGYGMATTLAGSMFPPDDFWRSIDAQGGREELPHGRRDAGGYLHLDDLRQLHADGAVFAGRLRLLRRGRERAVRRRRPSGARARAIRPTPRAGISPNPTCRAGRSISKRCCRCAGSAASAR